jgi:hypothetical protein
VGFSDFSSSVELGRSVGKVVLDGRVNFIRTQMICPTGRNLRDRREIGAVGGTSEAAIRERQQGMFASCFKPLRRGSPDCEKI